MIFDAKRIIHVVYIVQKLERLLTTTPFNRINKSMPRIPVLDGGCNPYVDMIFVLDKSTNVTDVDFDMQMNFINLLLKDHKAPQGAVRVAIMTCADNDTTYSPFTDDISPTSSLYLPPSTLYETDSSRHCLDNLNFMFKTKARDGVARQAVILRGSWDWNLEQVKVYAKTAKDENTVVVVIAIGIKKFDSLSALQLLATGDSTYFVLSKFQNLKDLAAVLAKDNCKRKFLAMLWCRFQDQFSFLYFYRMTCSKAKSSIMVFSSIY